MKCVSDEKHCYCSNCDVKNQSVYHSCMLPFWVEVVYMVYCPQRLLIWDVCFVVIAIIAVQWAGMLLKIVFNHTSPYWSDAQQFSFPTPPLLNTIWIFLKMYDYLSSESENEMKVFCFVKKLVLVSHSCFTDINRKSDIIHAFVYFWEAVIK